MTRSVLQSVVTGWTETVLKSIQGKWKENFVEATSERPGSSGWCGVKTEQVNCRRVNLLAWTAGPSAQIVCYWVEGQKI